jgi:hypothetical protein
MANYIHALYIENKMSFLEYISTHQRYNIIKSPKGFPDMRYSINKQIFNEYLEWKQKNVKNIERFRNKFTEEEFVQNKIKSYNCVICMDEIDDNLCMLKCKHAFCVSCYSQHIRIKNDCPLCRDVICEKVKKGVILPDEAIHLLVDGELRRSYPERQNLPMKQFIEKFVHNPNDVESIMNEMSQTITDIAFQVNDHYERQ